MHSSDYRTFKFGCTPLIWRHTHICSVSNFAEEKIHQFCTKFGSSGACEVDLVIWAWKISSWILVPWHMKYRWNLSTSTCFCWLWWCCNVLHRNHVTWDLGHVFFWNNLWSYMLKNVWILALYLNILAQFLVHIRDMVYCHCLSLRNVSLQQDPHYSGVTWRLCFVRKRNCVNTDWCIDVRKTPQT